MSVPERVGSVCLALLLVTGCAPDQSRDISNGGSAGRPADSRGAADTSPQTVAGNPVQLERDVSIESEDREGRLLGRVQSAAASPDGGLYVWDGTIRELRKYDSEGQFVRQVGRVGQGPGELQEPFGMTVLPNTDLAVWDAPQGRVTVFDSSGVYRYSWRAYSNLLGTDGLKADTAGNLLLLVSLDTPGKAVGAASREGLERHERLSGRVIDTIAAPISDHVAALRVETKHGSSTIRVPYSTKTRWSYGPDGSIAAGDGSSYAIDVYRPGEAPARIVRALPAVAIDHDERRDIEERLLAIAHRQDPSFRWSSSPVPTRKPLFSDLRFDNAGRLWVRRSVPSVRLADKPERSVRSGGVPSPRWREPVVYDLFDPTGSYMGYVSIPTNATLLLSERDGVWLVERDSVDVPSIVRYRLALSAN